MLSGNAMSSMTVWLNVLYLLCRYAHIISTMLLVGGVLFYEMVVPSAISELPEPAQLAVFARARWAFRRVIFTCITIIVLTGIYMTFWRMQSYIEGEFVPSSIAIFSREDVPWPLRTGWWWAGHVVSAIFALGIAFTLVSGDRPPKHPVSWLRLDLMLLMVVIFFATVTRQVDQIHQDRAARSLMYSPSIRYVTPPLDNPPPETSATRPATP